LQEEQGISAGCSQVVRKQMNGKALADSFHSQSFLKICPEFFVCLLLGVFVFVK